MPTIFDNIEKKLSEGLFTHLEEAKRVDYCVGYFNLRGWGLVSDQVGNLTGMPVTENNNKYTRHCRLLVGMIKTPKEIIIESYFEN